MTVTVRPASALAARPRLFAALEAAFPVSFRPHGGSGADADAVIVVCDDAVFADSKELAREGVPVLAVGGTRERRDTAEAVKLRDHHAVDRRIRGVQLRDRLDGPYLARLGEGEEVLACAASGAAWTATRGAPVVHRVRSALPEMPPGEVLRGFLASRPMALVALVQLLRTVVNDHGFDDPPLRAAFVFDDPNLRWRTYGFIDYARLVEHADVHGYHASMAMIPLDARLPHRPTARLFRERFDRLSLVCHGNNHVNLELMRPQDESEALVLAAQAMRRVARFESRYGLPVGRVMIPPHGMCSESTTRALGTLGFDALCAAHAVPWTERPPASRLLAGWGPAEFVGGCAVIQRVPFTTSANDLAIRAFLGQPLVLYGHHDDLSDGLDLLADAAARINRLGAAQWTSLGEIAATNYAVQVDADTICVRPYARRLRVRVPIGVRQLIVKAPRDSERRLTGWSGEEDPLVSFDVPTGCQGAEIEIRIRAAAEADPAHVRSPTWQAWPVFRRAATEVRDRAGALRPSARPLAGTGRGFEPMG